MTEPLLGAHVSIAGGTPNALERAAERRVAACQIFVKNASQWRGKKLSAAEIGRFRQRRGELGIECVVAHGTYLVNLAATDAANRERSVATLADELDRSTALGLDGLVIHPGAHLGAGEEAGLARIARNLDRVLARRRGPTAPILLECTAGQGTVLGHRLEHLSRILETSRFGDRLRVCIDTCHAFAAGYRIDRRDGLADLLDRVDGLFGLDRLGCLHLNDSRYPAGSRRDRHANLGEGEIGLATFRWIVTDPRLAGVPMILETPLGDDGQGHARDLEILRGLVKARR
jgi:deoxyribonuclease-4